MDALATALAFDRSLRVRAAHRSVTLPHGVAILHDGLRHVHHLNSVIFDAPLRDGLDAAGIADEAERWLGHLRHRHVVLDDSGAAAAVAPDLMRAGWSMQRTMFMALGAAADRPAREGVAREVEVATLRALELRLTREEPPVGADAGFAERVVQSMDALRATSRARCFAAGENGEVAAACTLFLDPGRTALVDNVGTLRAWRRRGLARAVVTAATEAACDLGCDPIVIQADLDDWPKRLYRQMGFLPLGVQVAFTLARAR